MAVVRVSEWWTTMGRSVTGQRNRGHVEAKYIVLSELAMFHRTPPRLLSRKEIERTIAVSGYTLPYFVEHHVRWEAM